MKSAAEIKIFTQIIQKYLTFIKKMANNTIWGNLL